MTRQVVPDFVPEAREQVEGARRQPRILVQLRLEELVGGNRLAAQARRQLLPFFRSLGLPVDLADLGLADASLNDLKAACAFAGRPDSDLHNLPFAVSSDDLLTALVSTTTIPVASPRQS